jgi:hypothetical protein
MPAKKEEVVIDGEKIKFKKGALHTQLKVPQSYTFTKSELNKIKKVENGQKFNFHGKEFKMTPLLKRRVAFALVLMGNKK